MFSEMPFETPRGNVFRILRSFIAIIIIIAIIIT
jgi:hypothetical protein